MSSQTPLDEVPKHGFSTSAARSVDVTLVNMTERVLRLDDSGVGHGDLRIAAPANILPGRKGRWMLESSGLMKGADGWTKWRIVDENGSAVVKLEYESPWHGSNSFSGSVEGDDSESYLVGREGGSGDNARVFFTLRNRKFIYIPTYIYIYRSLLHYFFQFLFSQTVNTHNFLSRS